MARSRSAASCRNPRLCRKNRTDAAIGQHGHCRRQRVGCAASAHCVDTKRVVRGANCGDRHNAQRRHRRRNSGCATCFAASARRPVRPCLGEPRPVKGPLPIWRFMAWPGAKLCESGVAGKDGSRGWQDKSGASRWGVGPQNCSGFRASRYITRLALFREILAFPARSEPAVVRLAVQP